MVSPTGEFVGVRYSTRERLDPAVPRHNAPPPPDAPLTLMGWELNPAGLGKAICSAARSGLPVVITENGIATVDDAERVAYVRDDLAEVAGALRDGVDVRGYLYWSAFGNFEWNEGYRPTFGMLGIDRGGRAVPRGARERTGSSAVFE